MLKTITIKTAGNHCDKAEGTHANKFLFFMLLTLECKIFRNVGIIVFNTGALPVSTLVTVSLKVPQTHRPNGRTTGQPGQ